MKAVKYLAFITIFLIGCANDKATQVGENTFVYNNKVYKLIDNQLTKIADLQSKDSSKPQPKQFGSASISYLKEGATAEIIGLYRGNFLYFKMRILGLNDLKENYLPGRFTIEFTDEFGFVLNSILIDASDLVGTIGDDGKIEDFEYNGKTELSPNIFNVIKSFSVNSTIKRNN